VVVTSIHSLIFDYFVLFNMYTDDDEVQANGEAFACSVEGASGQGMIKILQVKLAFETVNENRST